MGPKWWGKHFHHKFILQLNFISLKKSSTNKQFRIQTVIEDEAFGADVTTPIDCMQDWAHHKITPNLLNSRVLLINSIAQNEMCKRNRKCEVKFTLLPLIFFILIFKRDFSFTMGTTKLVHFTQILMITIFNVQRKSKGFKGLEYRKFWLDSYTV